LDKNSGKIIAKQTRTFCKHSVCAKKMAIKIEQRNYVPVYDLNLEPLMDIHKIMAVSLQTTILLMIVSLKCQSHVVG
jgi:UDP-3-O-[3-hydroxymyristoyl] N-acetylglucosamine deacetylase/3-hydroxyacyl-[acyl-carrier-protein] dehydratase